MDHQDKANTERRLSSGGPAAPAREPSAAEVAAYLRKHPDFLVDHPELIATLTPPERRHGDGVLDLQQFMLQRLRGDVARLKTQQRTLVATSRSNLSSQGRIHAAVLAVIGATSFEQLIQIVTTDLAVLLDVDLVTIGIESTAGGRPRLPLHGIHMLRSGTVQNILGAEREVVLRADMPGEPALFGDAAGIVRSQALLRLAVSERTPPGLLCIGTRRPDKFHPGQGTELLSFLARVIGLTIAAWLDLAA